MFSVETSETNQARFYVTRHAKRVTECWGRPGDITIVNRRYARLPDM